MFLNRLHRALSSFNHVTHCWAAIPLRDPHYPIRRLLLTQQTPSASRAWVALHGSTGSDGATCGVGVELEGGLKAGRLDKIVMLGLKPDEIEVLQPGLNESDRPWSDHCGLRCTFTI